MTGTSTSPLSPESAAAGPLSSSEWRNYWEQLASQWTMDDNFQLWRRHSDWVNGDLLQRWFGNRPVKRLLKTDLFDEAVCDGLVPLLEDNAETIVGIDVSSKMIDLARRRYPRLRVQQADIRRLPFDDGWFDSVVSFSTLDHFDLHADIVASVREITRVLRPGGQLLLTLDNLANPIVWLRNILPYSLLHRTGLVPYYVGKSCNPRLLQDYIRRAGLVDVETTAVMHCPRVLAVALACWLQRRAPLRIQERFLKFLRPFEMLGRYPSRFVTGHFIALLARKPT